MRDELPTIACDAAIALDNILIDNEPDLADIGRLADWLFQSFACGVSPDRVLTLWNTLKEIGNTAEMRVTDDVVRETRSIADALKAASFETDPDDLKRLREYCIALSTRASAETAEKRSGSF